MAKETQGNVDARQLKADSRQGDADVVQMFGGGTTTDGYIAIYDATGNVVCSTTSLAALLAAIGSLPTYANHWTIVSAPGYNMAGSVGGFGALIW